MSDEELADQIRASGTVLLLDSLDPETAHWLVEELYPTDVGLAFDLADGLYWHCAHYHGGQGSMRYSILSQLDYTPGATEDWPTADDEERDEPHHVYTLLEMDAQR